MAHRKLKGSKKRTEGRHARGQRTESNAKKRKSKSNWNDKSGKRKRS